MRVCGEIICRLSTHVVLLGKDKLHEKMKKVVLEYEQGGGKEEVWNEFKLDVDVKSQ